jgi:uncharacterized protein (DUF427 family)
MTDLITIRPAAGTFVLRAGDAVLGESTQALELSDSSDAPVIYFPRGDIAMAFLELSPTGSTSTHLGDASHYSIITPSGTIKDAAWSYEDPRPGVAAIAGHLAFYADKVTVERV